MRICAAALRPRASGSAEERVQLLAELIGVEVVRDQRRVPRGIDHHPLPLCEDIEARPQVCVLVERVIEREPELVDEPLDGLLRVQSRDAEELDPGPFVLPRDLRDAGRGRPAPRSPR